MGFTGNCYARFSNFICPLSESARYFKQVAGLKAKRYLAPNPAGALIIVLLLLSLLLTVSGLDVYATDQNAEPLAGIIGEANEDL